MDSDKDFIETICEYCGKRILVSAEEHENNDGDFCSDRCKKKSGQICDNGDEE